MSNYDYDGEFGKYQKELDGAGIEFDITNLYGCTRAEIEGFVYGQTHFKCRSCGSIAKVVKDESKRNGWICETCRKGETTLEN